MGEESNHLLELRDRLRNVITNTCNSIGCKNCDLKWDGECSATELQNKINDQELKETESHE